MRVDWCVSSWFRIKNTHSLTPTRNAQNSELCSHRRHTHTHTLDRESHMHIF